MVADPLVAPLEQLAPTTEPDDAVTADDASSGAATVEPPSGHLAETPTPAEPYIDPTTARAAPPEPPPVPRYVRPRHVRARRVEPEPLDADQASSLLLALATESLPTETARALLDLARPTLSLTATTPTGDITRVSRFGGLPLLSSRTPWPEHQGHPLHFVGQIDLSETGVHDTDLTLPRIGLLSFFYLPEDDLWGYDPDDRTGWRVLRTDASMGQLCELPEGVPMYEPRRLEPRATWTLPDSAASVLDPLRAAAGTVVDEVVDAFHQAGGRTRHQLLGWPSEGQDAMARAAATASGGVFAGTGTTGTTDPTDPTGPADPAGWQLLLQVDSDDDAGMVWGDDCRLCFWLPTQSLVTGKLSDAWMLMRCG